MLKKRVKNGASSFKGQKSGLPLESYGFDSAELIQNFVLKEGQLKRVNGGVIYANVLEGQQGGVTSLHRMKNLWIAQRGTAIAMEDEEGSATFTTIFSDLDSVEKMRSSIWRDRIFFNNGVDARFIYNQTNDAIDENQKAAQHGIALITTDDDNPYPPQYSIAAPNAGNVANGTYSYIVTLFDEVTNSESPGIGALQGADGQFEVSEFSNIGPAKTPFTVTGGPKRVDFGGTTAFLAEIQALCPRATHFIVYRAVADGSGVMGTHFQIGHNGASNPYNSIPGFIDAGTNFMDNSAATSDVSLPENNSPPPSIAAARMTYNYFRLGRTGIGGPTFLEDPLVPFPEDLCVGPKASRFFRDQLFMVADTCGGLALSTAGAAILETVPGTVFNYDSILRGSEVFQPDYFPYQWEVGRGDGQDTIGLGVLGDTALLIFKEKSTYYLSGSSPDDYVVRIMDTNKGCVSDSTIQETPIGVICLDRTGFVLYNKIGQGVKISGNIQDVIDDIEFRYSDTFYSHYDPKDMRYYCSVVIPGSTTPNLSLCLDLESMEWTTIQGFNGLSRLADTDSLGEYVELIGSESNGRLVNLADEEIVTFADSPIESIWTSGGINFGDDQHKKKMRWLYIRAKGNASWTINIEVIPDFDESRKFVLENFNNISSQSTWYSSDAASDGSLLWDEGSWAFDGLERKVVKIPIACKGYVFQVRIINRDTDPNRWGFAIEGISAEAVMLEK